MQLRWLPCPLLSAVHAAWAVLCGRRIIDPDLAAQLQQPTMELVQSIGNSVRNQALYWEHLLGLAGGIHLPRELADVAIRKTGLPSHANSSQASERIAGSLHELERSLLAYRPNLREELELRAGPLRQMWEARGPGLLRVTGQLTDPALIVENADIQLVHPVLGGGGWPHLPYNSVRWEAVLSNPHADLPEMVRLAWLLSQLNIDVPMFSELIHGSRRNLIAQLAMLPPVIEAAAAVEIVAGGRPAIEAAFFHWGLDRPFRSRPTPDESAEGCVADTVGETVGETDGAADRVHGDVNAGIGSDAGPGQDRGEAASVLDALDDWWDTYRDSRPNWTVALRALDQMVESSLQPG